MVAQSFFPNMNVLIKEQDGNLSAFINDYKGKVETFLCTDDGKIEINSDFYHFKGVIHVDTKNSYVECDQYYSRIVDLGNFHNIKHIYSKSFAVIVYTNLVKQIVFIVVANLFFVIIFLNLKKKKINILDYLTFKSEFEKKISTKRCLFLGGFICATVLFKPGCDLGPISSAISMHLSGVDIYQIQNIAEVNLFSVNYNTWPYNPFMLFIYSIPNVFSFSYSPFFVSTSFDTIQAIIIKLVNSLLLIITIISIGSVLKKWNILPANSGSWIKFSFFNPLVFYVAIIFIQLDVLPLYLTIVGLNNIFMQSNRSSRTITGLIMIALGLMCKLQNLILGPTIIIALLMLILQKKIKISYILWFVVFLIIPLFNIIIANPIIRRFLASNKQSLRVWWEYFEYAQDYYMYLTLFFVGITFLIYISSYKKSMSLVKLYINTLTLNSSIVLVFSASIISTPSTLILCLPAFVLLNYFEKDSFRIILIATISVLCVIDVMLSDIGDITNFLNYFGYDGIFSSLQHKYIGSEKGVKLASVLLTLTRIGMVSSVMILLNNVKQINPKLL